MIIRYAGKEDIQQALDIRLECLRAVNGLPEDYVFVPELIERSRACFLSPEQTTVLAMEDGRPVACATLCALRVMPTFSHPTGLRGHLMNVYTHPAYRRQGIARRMVEMLMDEARQKGMTEISLDATDEGRALYEALGFSSSEEAMTLLL